MRYTDADAIRTLQEITGITFSEEQEKILNHRGGLHIVACAGSGKTTTLVYLVTKRIMTGEIANARKLLMTTYSKSGADEMSERINALLRQVGCNDNVEVKTMHASYYKCLAHFNMIKKVVSSGQRRMFIRQAVKEVKLRLEDKDIEDLDGILSYQINNMMNDEQVYRSAVFTLEMSLEDYTNIRSGYARKKQENNMIDFDDMQYYMYYFLCVVKNPEFIKYCKSRWEYYYIDEFQDTSKIQFAIVRALATKSENLMVIGDDDQCIYAWRGADPSIILNIGAYYDLKKFYLSTNYRCREAILKFAERGVKNMYNREEKEMNPFKKAGVVNFSHFYGKDLFGMTEHICSLIIKELENGASPDDIAVLMRNNIHACVLGSMLAQSGFNVKTNAEMKLSNLSYFKDLEMMVDMLGDQFTDQTYDKNIATNMLWKLVPYFGTNGSSAVYEVMSNTSLGLTDAIDYLLYSGFGIGKFTKNINIPKSVEFRINMKIRRISRDSLVGLSALCAELHKENKVEAFNTLLALYKIGMGFTLKNPDTERVFACFMKYVHMHLQKNGIDAVRQLIASTKQLESDNVAIMGEKITLTTVHSSKGMEWKHVYLLAYDNISFPSFSYLDDIAGRSNVRKEDIIDYIDGERRLNYVALTRAINELTLIGDFNNFSIFGLENLGINIESDSPDKLVRMASKWVATGEFDYVITKDVIEEAGYDVIETSKLDSGTLVDKASGYNTF